MYSSWASPRLIITDSKIGRHSRNLGLKRTQTWGSGGGWKTPPAARFISFNCFKYRWIFANYSNMKTSPQYSTVQKPGSLLNGAGWKDDVLFLSSMLLNKFCQFASRHERERSYRWGAGEHQKFFGKILGLLNLQGPTAVDFTPEAGAPRSVL